MHMIRTWDRFWVEDTEANTGKSPPPKLVVVRELQQAADKPGVIRQTGGWLAPGTVMGERVTIPQLTH